MVAAATTVVVSLLSSPLLLAALGALVAAAVLFEAGRRSARRDLGKLYDYAVGPVDEGDAIGDLVIRRDAAGRITSTSTATTSLLGQPPGAFIRNIESVP